ncbi:MAG: 50S ribosomal protein L3 [Gammaproteobacteria bacterium]|nr:50S ribosomal protein L3 [Gammaproteobacteria bacterium]
MAIGIVGIKTGMTRVFKEDGSSVPVTVIHADPNRVTQVKSDQIRENGKTDGYNAIQVTLGKKKVSRVNKPALGHYRKAGIEAGLGLWEFTVSSDLLAEYAVGSELKVDQFAVGQTVDVMGISKGKGFAGTVKRHNFRTQDATHGNSVSHRVPGSTGQNQSPGKVFKGKKMCGHLGDVRCSVQNLEVVLVDAEKNILAVKGGVPGAAGGFLVIKPAVKAKAE